MDTPIVIWQLFRSPVYRYFYQLEDRNWNLSRTIEHACVEFPLPVTPQSLEADEALNQSVVTARDAGCRAKGIPFQAEIWRAFWPCIQQSVQCMSFQREDLFPVQYQFRGLLRFQDKGYPVLDELLSERLEAEFAASYIDLWRGLMNRKTDAPNRGGAQPRTKAQKLAEFREGIKTYRGLFKIRRQTRSRSGTACCRCAEIFASIKSTFSLTVRSSKNWQKNGRSRRGQEWGPYPTLSPKPWKV